MLTAFLRSGFSPA